MPPEPASPNGHTLPTVSPRRSLPPSLYRYGKGDHFDAPWWPWTPDSLLRPAYTLPPPVAGRAEYWPRRRLRAVACGPPRRGRRRIWTAVGRGLPGYGAGGRTLIGVPNAAMPPEGTQAGCSTGSARLGSARLGSARLGSARLGSARLGSARLGSARLGSGEIIALASSASVKRNRPFAAASPCSRGTVGRTLRCMLDCPPANQYRPYHMARLAGSGLGLPPQPGLSPPWPPWVERRNRRGPPWYNVGNRVATNDPTRRHRALRRPPQSVMPVVRFPDSAVALCFATVAHTRECRNSSVGRAPHS